MSIYPDKTPIYPDKTTAKYRIMRDQTFNEYYVQRKCKFLFITYWVDYKVPKPPLYTGMRTKRFSTLDNAVDCVKEQKMIDAAVKMKPFPVLYL